MTQLEMRYEPDPVLREKAKRIKVFDARLRKLADDMLETMHANNGVGLAAPQVGMHRVYGAKARWVSMISASVEAGSVFGR